LLVASVFLKYLQLSSAGAALIHVSEESIRANPDVSIELGTKRMPVSTGRQFGSRYPGDPSKMAVYDFVPDTLLHQVRNLSDFLGVLVFDKWVSKPIGGRRCSFAPACGSGCRAPPRRTR
jgi:hypothetical protein